MGPKNDVAPLKIITYRAIKTTGTLIVIIYKPWLLALIRQRNSLVPTHKKSSFKVVEIFT